MVKYYTFRYSSEKEFRQSICCAWQSALTTHVSNSMVAFTIWRRTFWRGTVRHAGGELALKGIWQIWSVLTSLTGHSGDSKSVARPLAHSTVVAASQHRSALGFFMREIVGHSRLAAADWLILRYSRQMRRQRNMIGHP